MALVPALIWGAAGFQLEAVFPPALSKDAHGIADGLACILVSGLRRQRPGVVEGFAGCAASDLASLVQQHGSAEPRHRHHIAPSLLFSMRDHVNDRLWWRPYVGLAGHYVHAPRTDLIYLYATETASTFGARVFAGAETAFARLPRFTISADADCYHLRPPFVGLDPSGVGFALSGHWYMK